MSPLESWLESHGLAQYAKVFADNDVDLDILGALTDADLEKLGVSLGHRRKLAQALEALRRAPGAQAARIATDGQDAERRHVTVVFCDLVGSTELAASIDPEVLSALIRRYQQGCADAIRRYEGFVAKYLGDGVLAYFGYPQAGEDDAERAVRASLAIIDAVRKLALPDGRAPTARIGIATGTVVIGDVIGEGPAREHSIVGETPNLAARLQAIAEPDAIVVGPGTYQLLGRQFEVQSLGPQRLKGFAEPVPAWRVLREAPTESRFLATRRADDAFVGRADELKRMLDAWEQTSAGRGRAVVITGDAGMGKSRLVDTFFQRIGPAHRNHVTCQCSPYHTNSALHPVIRHLERAAGFASADDANARLAKLEAMLGAASDGAACPSTTLIADLLSLPVDRYPRLDLSPAQRKSATLDALVDVLKRLAESAPVILLLEDAHWADPTTLELWTRLIDRIGASRVLALVTARTEFVSPWKSRDNASAIELARLTDAQSTELAVDVSSSHPLAPEVIEDIVRKADGIPLFVEELTKSVLEALADRLVVPATLQDSLMARLDRLGSAKEIAQIAAVIGPQFSHALLAYVAPCDGDQLVAALGKLIHAGLVFHQSRTAELGYTFRHALLRDVAYENLLRARRQQIHARIANALVTRFPSIAESEPEVPAHHFAQAGESALACTWGERAGDHATARSSYSEAVAHFGAALAEAGKLPDEPTRRRRELDIMLKLGPLLAILRGPQHAEVGDLYRRAQALAATLSDDAALFKSTWGLWFNANVGRRLDVALAQADRLVEHAHRSGNDDFVLESLHCKWSTAMFRGDMRTAASNALEGVRRYDRAKHAWMGPVFGGHDPGVCACVVRQVALSLAGEFAEPRELAERADALAVELAHQASAMHVIQNNVMAAQIRGEREVVHEGAQRLIGLAEKFGIPPQRAHGRMLLGWALATGGEPDEGLRILEAEYPKASAVGPLYRYYAVMLAEQRLRCGRYADALALLDAAIATVTEPGVGIFVSELHRLRGLALLRTGSGARGEALATLESAVAIARAQGATQLELYAVTSLARARAGGPDADRGVDDLRAFLASLSPTFESPGLAEARTLAQG